MGAGVMFTCSTSSGKGLSLQLRDRSRGDGHAAFVRNSLILPCPVINPQLSGFQL